MRALSLDEFEVAAERSTALLLDTRNDAAFSAAHIPNSINIGLEGDFAPWVGALVIDVKQPILLIAEPGKEKEAITRLSRVGFDNTLGYLEGGFHTWMNAGKNMDSVHRITAEQFEQEFQDKGITILDVRKEGEYKAEHIRNAENRPLAYINEWIKNLNQDQHFYLHCAGGYRSMIAASILQARGYRNFTEVGGGINAIKATKIPLTDYFCETTRIA
jgi:rhodanese-related sulfurtransferase